jgi:hypothetical protein
VNEKTLELFEKNYKNEGMCKNLPSFIKSFTKTFKKDNTEKVIRYYPWAVVERIFRMQGGEIIVENWVKEIEVVGEELLPNEEGEFVPQEKTSKALFIELKATWNGEELHEVYPIFDNQSSKIIKTPSAMNLNTSRQRGSVRLIARISGIGLDIFEQQDSQFEGEGTPESDGERIVIKEKKESKESPQEEAPQPPEKKFPEKPKSKKTNKTTKEKRENDKKKQQEAMEEITKKDEDEYEDEDALEVKEADSFNKKEEEKTGSDFLKSIIEGAEVEPPVEKIEEEAKDFKEKTFGKDTQEYADLLLEVRKTIRNGHLQKVAKGYVSNYGKELLSQLTYDELSEIKDNLEADMK